MIEIGRFRLMSAGAALELPAKSEDDYLLGPLVERGYLTIVGGETGHGKTTFALQMLAAIVSGRAFLGWQGVGRKRVLVVDLEQSESSIQKRIAELRLSSEELERMTIASCSGGLSSDADLDTLERILAGGEYDAVLIDPLYKSHASDSNSDQEMDKLLRRFDDWRRRFNFALIVCAHLRKSALTFGGVRRLRIDDIAGNGVIVRSAEVVIGVQTVGNGGSRMYFWKDRDGGLEKTSGSELYLDFTRETGYRASLDQTRSKKKSEKPAMSKLRAALQAQSPQPKAQLAKATGISPDSGTIEAACKQLGCTHILAKDGKTKLYSLPEAVE